MSSKGESELETLRRENEELRSRLGSSRKLQSELMKERKKENSKEEATNDDSHLSVVVLGGSGDLAQKKTFPALLSLFAMGLLPKEFSIVGYARSEMSQEEFKKKASKNFKEWKDKHEEFLSHLSYFVGKYDDVESFQKLDKELKEKEGSKKGNRLFYLAIPSSSFVDASKGIKSGCLAQKGWTRVVVEKPLGKDTKSSDELTENLSKLFTEDQLYRIDHYLGKEVVQSLIGLRFSNTIIKPLWNRLHISSVGITFKEDVGTEGRAGYFDQYGIIRDVMQNHLMQMLALVAMEAPVSMSASDIQDEKVKVMRRINPIKKEDIVVGQFKGYLEEKDVPKNSTTETFACARLTINDERWAGVPFFLKCGKGLNERKAEIRIQFNSLCSGLFECDEIPRNELVIRVQPNEAVYMKINSKVPGLTNELGQTELDLTYKKRFEARLPEAYERLIYDVIKGDHSLFVRDDELNIAWQIITPVLEHVKTMKPEVYEFGSRGPQSADDMIKKYGYIRNEDYTWKEPEEKKTEKKEEKKDEKKEEKK